MATEIEWVTNPDGTKGESWNPVVGCTPCSPGCAHCYAKRVHDLRHGAYPWPHAPKQYAEPFSVIQCIPERLAIPIQRRKPTTYFVNSVSDLFHEGVPDSFIRDAFGTMLACPRHRFIVLTKRSRRMQQLVSRLPFVANVWLGVSVEDQRRAAERVPDLLATPAAVRFLSCEPLLELLILSPWFAKHDPRGGLSWVICGGESGPGARPMHPDWARSLRDQCAAAGVPFFFKQMDKKQPIPDDLMIREYPNG